MNEAVVERAVEVAKSQAEKSPHYYRHGAVLGHGGEIVAVGYNGQECHAEERVLSKIPKHVKLRNLWLVVVRIGRGGELRMSRPCENCQRLIEEIGIPTVMYSE